MDLIIPIQFELINNLIKVEMEDKAVLRSLQDRNMYGEANYTKNQITINNTIDNEPIDRIKQVETFYHEKVHFILDAMGEHDMRVNEKFVDLFARLLLQSDMSAVYINS